MNASSLCSVYNGLVNFASPLVTDRDTECTSPGSTQTTLAAGNFHTSVFFLFYLKIFTCLHLPTFNYYLPVYLPNCRSWHNFNLLFFVSYLKTVNTALKCTGVKTQPDSMSQNTRKALSRNQGTPTETPPSTLVTNSKGLNPSPKRAVRDPKTGRGTCSFSLFSGFIVFLVWCDPNLIIDCTLYCMQCVLKKYSIWPFRQNTNKTCHVLWIWTCFRTVSVITWIEIGNPTHSLSRCPFAKLTEWESNQ